MVNSDPLPSNNQNIERALDAIARAILAQNLVGEKSVTPTISNLPTSSRSQVYTLIGNTVIVSGSFVASGAATNVITVSLPFPAANNYYIGTAWALSAGVAYFTGAVLVSPGSSLINFTTNGNSNQWNNVNPFTWKNTDSCNYSIVYTKA